MSDFADGPPQTYRASHPGLKVQTYFMMYQNSAEEQRYLSHIRRERESFEKLIKERSVRVLAFVWYIMPDVIAYRVWRYLCKPNEGQMKIDQRISSGP